MGSTLVQVPRYQEAAAHYQQALDEVWSRHMSDDVSSLHSPPLLSATLTNLGVVQFLLGMHKAAEHSLSESLRLQSRLSLDYNQMTAAQFSALSATRTSLAMVSRNAHTASMFACASETPYFMNVHEPLESSNMECREPGAGARRMRVASALKPWGACELATDSGTLKQFREPDMAHRIAELYSCAYIACYLCQAV